jgi:hypothetical protein
MFGYRPDWSDAAVRRFVRRVGPAALADLYALREADNAASGVREVTSGGLSELRQRASRELARTALSTRQLALGGDDLIAGLAIPPGPIIGRLLARLLEAVIEDPSRNERGILINLARAWLPEESEMAMRPPRRSAMVVRERTR